MKLSDKKEKYNFLDGEILLFNKPYEWTSFDVVRKIRYAIKRKTGIKKIKVGHAGTLDPLATGLLIICTGKFTKRIQEFQDLIKEYTGVFYLGATTPSFDKETEIDNVYDTIQLNNELLIKTANNFIGTYDQVPPLFSAVNIEGQRAYNFARKNIDMKLQPRKVSITEFELTKIQLPEVHFRVICSKGTYIRSLARDFGEILNTGAYLESLCRTKIGSYLLLDAMSLDDFVKTQDS